MIYRYGITSIEVDALLLMQNHECAICKTKVEFGGKGFKAGLEKNSAVVDHCHDTEKVRGILCRNCNLALGLFEDSPELLVRAAKYLDI